MTMQILARPIACVSVPLLLAGAAIVGGCYSPSSSPGVGESGGSTTDTTSVPGTDESTTAATVATTDGSTDESSDAATSSDDTSTGPETTDGESTAADDTTPPGIVELSPADGEIGVRGDVNLVVTFDEPMDQAATEAAYESPDIPAASVTFSWDVEGTILTIDPNDDLAYAQGAAPDVAALSYSFSLGATAIDLAGNELSNPATVTFTTLRQLTPSLPAVDAMTGDMAFNGTSLGIEVCVGDQYFMSGTNGWVNGGITFDLSTLPADIVEFQGATLQGDQVALNGTPYSALGDLRAEHVTFATLADLWSSVLLEDMGVFSDSPTFGTRTIDVLAQIEADYAAGDVSQYRLAFELVSDNDAAADYACFSKAPDDLFVALDYLVP